MAKKVSINDHVLIPKHTKISETEKKALFKEYGITFNELPKIFLEDPAIASLNVKVGDVIKIERKSPLTGVSIYYRGVING